MTSGILARTGGGGSVYILVRSLNGGRTAISTLPRVLGKLGDVNCSFRTLARGSCNCRRGILGWFLSALALCSWGGNMVLLGNCALCFK